MEIAANSRYSSYVNISGYERASLTADAEVIARVSVSHDSFTWFSVEEREYVLALRTAWVVPAYVFDYRYLRLQVRPTTTRRTVTVALSNELEQGIPAAAGAGQFPVSTADDVSWTPEPTGAGLEFPSLDGGTPKVYRFAQAASGPGAGDDINDGFQLGSFWLNTVTGDLFFCTDVSAGAAIWLKLARTNADGTITFGGTANYAQFGADGTLTLHGDARTTDDEVFDAFSFKITGPGVSLNMAEGTIDFTAAADLNDYAAANIQLKHDRDLAAPLIFHLHFFQAEDAVPNFLVKYRWQKNGTAKTTDWTPLKLTSLVFGYVEGTLTQIIAAAAITPPVDSGLSDILQIQLYRDTDNDSTEFAGVDPYTATVGVLSFDVHKVVDSLGSSDEYVK